MIPGVNSSVICKCESLVYNFVRGVKRVCRGVYCQQGNIMIRVNSRSLCKIREGEKMNFQAGFLKSARDYGS